MRILLTGATGQVGWELRRSLSTLGEVHAPARGALDLAQPGRLQPLVRSLRPEVIVNAAAYTAVDRAEAEEPLAAAINGEAPGVLAREAARLGAWLVHYSTDYVFDGGKPAPYLESDPPAPLNAYGRTKLAGEAAIAAAGARHLILRTSWVYGTRGHNFLNTIRRLARERETLSIVSDQVGAPTWSRAIAEATAQILVQLANPSTRDKFSAAGGLYHLTAGGACSWYEFAQAILRLDPARAEYTVREVRPIPTREYKSPAPRPLNSRLDCKRLQETFGVQLAQWEVLLSLALESP